MKRCSICNSQNIFPLPPQEFGCYAYMSCVACDAVWAILSSDEDIVKRYRDVQRLEESKETYTLVGEDSGSWRNRRLLFNNLLEKIGIADLEASLGRRPKVLDVGCGIGDLMEVFRFRDWDATGIEVNSAMVEFSRTKGRIVDNLSLEEISFDHFYYDMIFACHVIEHLSDPLLLFKKAKQLLAPGGWLVIVTPVYAHFDDPNTIFLLKEKSLRAAGKRTGFNFKWMHVYADKQCNNNGVANAIVRLEKKDDSK